MIDVRRVGACALLLLNMATALQAQTLDEDLHVYSDSVQTIGEVTVVAGRSFRDVIPSQSLKGEALERLSMHGVADALRYFSGIQLKDYGGVGGIKTVDIRSMGSNHLGVYYDGVQLGNAQNGQIDLGQFSLDNVEEVTLYNGQKSSLGQSASDFANAGSVYIRTRRPHFAEGEREHWRARLKYGSSDMLRSSLLYERALSDDLSLQLNGEFLTSSGKYHFRYRRKAPDGTIAWDTTAVRNNGDIHAERLEANLHYGWTGGSAGLKGYVYNSDRGIPGAIVNNVWKRGERQSDLNTFVQAFVHNDVSERFSAHWTAKYAYYNTHYVNRDTTQLPVDRRYKQQELYLSSVGVYDIIEGWSVALSYDFKWNKLDADSRHFAYPTRLTNMIALSSATDLGWLRMQGSVLASMVNDRTFHGAKHGSISRISPALFATFYPLSRKNATEAGRTRNRELSVRAFVKRSFRMPTFNDLYYTDIGNAALRPECATQVDAGIAWTKEQMSHTLQRLKLQCDVYYNMVDDKIIAYPKGQQFRWTMMNLGKVKIRGIDAEAESSFAFGRDWSVMTRLQYTYQDARDVTDRSDSYYHHQIAYIPLHSGSATLCLRWKSWQLDYSFIYTGERYNGQENIQENHMQPWYTSDLSLMYDCRCLKLPCRIQVEVNNLFDQNYDVILNYPMPGRNYAISLQWNL